MGAAVAALSVWDPERADAPIGWKRAMHQGREHTYGEPMTADAIFGAAGLGESPDD